jgi:nicotinamidase-related amidase
MFSSVSETPVGLIARPGTVLVVIDVQRDVVAGAYEESRALAVVGGLVAAARQAGRQVVWVRHEDEQLAAGSPGAGWAGGLEPAASEPVITKAFRDAFEQTSLKTSLSDLSAVHLVIVGAQSEYCVNTTAHRALVEGFDVTLVADGHTTTEPTTVSGVTARQVIEHTNEVFRSLRYPGRTVSVTTSSSLGDWRDPRAEAI